MAGFMERRLKLSKELLRDTGVIFVSIDDAEQHRLRMLLDQVFGEGNFVDTLAVEMSTTSGPKTVNAQQGTIVKNVEYVHIYKRSAAFDRVRHTPLFDAVEGWDSNYSLWLNEDHSVSTLDEALQRDPAVMSELRRFDLLDPKGRPAPGSLDTALKVSPTVTKFVVDNRDRIARTDRVPVSCADADPPIGRYVEFEAPERTYLIGRLSEGRPWQLIPLARNFRQSDDYKPRFGRTVIRGDLWKGFHSDMAHVANEGMTRFSNGKKPVRLIKQLIRWANNAPDAIVLDFFAGSGSTAHAVMEMNEEDDGQRRAVLVTNNEVSEQTRRRLRKQGSARATPNGKGRASTRR